MVPINLRCTIVSKSSARIPQSSLQHAISIFLIFLSSKSLKHNLKQALTCNRIMDKSASGLIDKAIKVYTDLYNRDESEFWERLMNEADAYSVRQYLAKTCVPF